MAVVVVVAAVVTAVITVTIFMSKEVYPRKSWWVEALVVVTVGEAHSGLKLYKIDTIIP